MDPGLYLRPNPTQYPGLQKLREKAINPWLNQNEHKGCSQWRREQVRMKDLYQLAANKNQKEILDKFNVNENSGVLSIKRSCSKNKGLYHTTCLDDFSVNIFDIIRGFNCQVEFKKQEEQILRMYASAGAGAFERDWRDFQKNKRTIKFTPNKGKPTKVDLGSAQIEIPELSTDEELHLDYHGNNSIENSSRIPEFPSLFTSDSDLLSFSMGAIQIRDKEGNEVLVNKPLKYKQKIPQNMSMETAKEFKKYVYSHAKNVWIEKGGLNVNQKTRQFQLEIETTGSLGKQYFFEEVSSFYSRFQEQIEKNILEVVQKNQKFEFPKYRQSVIRQKQERIEELYRQLSQAQGSPTYFPQILREHYKKSFFEKQDQMQFNFFRNNVQQEIVREVTVGKQKFYFCSGVEQIEKVLNQFFIKFQKNLVKAHIQKHNEDVKKQIEAQSGIRINLQNMTWKFAEEKEQYSLLSTHNQEKVMIQKQEYQKQTTSKRLQLQKLAHQTLKTINFADEFILKRVYITKQQYESILFNQLIESCFKESQRALASKIISSNAMKMQVKSEEIFVQKNYYKTYPNIFYLRGKSMDFVQNPIVPQSSFKMFEEYLDNYQQSQLNSDEKFKQIEYITEEYDKNVPKLKKEDFKKLLNYKVQKSEQARQKITNKMRNKVQQYSELQKTCTKFPAGFQYCIEVLEKIEQNDKLIKQFPSKVISGYRKSGLPRVYGGDTPPALNTFASYIADRMKYKCLTKKQVLSSGQMMYQCSGIDVFDIIDKVQIRVVQTFADNQKRIQLQIDRILKFVDSDQFLKQINYKFQTKYSSYEKIKYFEQVNQFILEIQQKLIVQFNSFANKTVTIYYFNIDFPIGLRRLSRGQINYEISDMKYTFLQRISKPIPPNYDPGDINLIYSKKVKISQKYELQKEIMESLLGKYKEKEIFPKPPYYQKYQYDGLLKQLKDKKKIIQNKLLDSEQYDKNIVVIKNLEKEIGEKEILIQEPKKKMLNFKLPHQEIKDVKQENEKKQPQNNDNKTKIEKLKQYNNSITPLTKVEAQALQQQIALLSSAIKNCQKNSNQIKQREFTTKNLYQNLIKLRKQAMQTQTFYEAKIKRDKYTKKLNFYLSYVYTLKQIILIQKQEWIKNNAQGRANAFSLHKDIYHWVNQLIRTTFFLNGQKNEKIHLLSKKIQNGLQHIQLTKQTYGLQGLQLSLYCTGNLIKIIRTKYKMQQDLTSMYTYINNLCNSKISQYPQHAGILKQINGIKLSLQSTIKNQIAIKKDLYFEDIVIGYNRFRKDFDGVKAKFEGFIRAVGAG